jgi:hypothetical protein
VLCCVGLICHRKLLTLSESKAGFDNACRVGEALLLSSTVRTSMRRHLVMSALSSASYVTALMLNYDQRGPWVACACHYAGLRPISARCPAPLCGLTGRRAIYPGLRGILDSRTLNCGAQSVKWVSFPASFKVLSGTMLNEPDPRIWSPSSRI